MKNIVACCDGTSNHFASARTNVSHLVYCLDQGSRDQIVYYQPGIGTMAPPGALTRPAKAVSRALGLMFGYGLPRDVRDIYTFLINTYEPGDRIFLFGFSRGAYIVRAVASLVHAYGLIPPGNEALVPYAVRYMTDTLKHNPTDAHVQQTLAVAGQFKETFSRTRPCDIHFVGVWDTVGSVGWFANPLVLPFTADNPSINIGRQALALDERRAFFRTNRWTRNSSFATHGPRDEKQVWFAGSHGDVGGGWPEAESGLSKIALEWMLDEAAAAGLKIDQVRRDTILGYAGTGNYTKPSPGMTPHDTLVSWWRLLEYLPKRNGWTGKWRPNLGKRRTVRPGGYIHRSVFAQPQPYIEANVPDDHEPEPQ